MWVHECYGPDKKILFKKQLFDLEVKGQGPTKVIMVCDTPPYGHAPTYFSSSSSSFSSSAQRSLSGP
jgi:hypothetical protein